MEQIQQSELLHIYPSGPVTERGQGTVTQINKNRMVYCSSNLVILRNLDDFENCEYYDGHREQTTCAKLSYSGAWVCSGDERGNIHIWDALGKDHVARYQYEKTLSGVVKDIAWTSDNQRVAAVGEGKDTFGKVFLIDTGSKVGDLNMNGKKVITVDIRPQRPFRLALAGEEFSTNWYEGPPYKWKNSQKFHTSFINCLRFSPDGSYFITVSSDRKIVLYHGKEGTMIKEIQNTHQGGIWFTTWLSNTTFATSSGDKTIKIWDVKENDVSCIKTLNVSEKPSLQDQQVSVQKGSNDNQVVSLSLGGSFNFFENYSNQELPNQVYQQHQNVVNQLVYTNNTLISADKSGKILFWNGNQSVLPQGDGHQKEILSLQITEDEKTLYTLCRKGEIKKLDIASRTFLKTQTIEKLVICLQTVGNDTVYVLCGDQIVILKELEIVETINLDKFLDPTYMAISQDGQYIAIGNVKGKIQIIKEGKKIHDLSHLEKRITYMKFSSKYLYSGDSSGKINVWDVESGQSKTERWHYHSQMIQSINIVKNYVLSSSLDNRLLIFNEDNFEKIGEVQNIHSQGIYSTYVNQQGDIFTGGSDWLIKKLRTKQLPL